MAIKLLIGGSPCTHWSIAQRNRETTAEGSGWELFRNYLIAKDKFNPDFFLYENNKSASKEIKEQIAKELGVGTNPFAKFTYINSALVSAQNRQRFYVTNFGDIVQPKDRGILLKDILESGEDLTGNDKSFCLTATYNKAVPWNTIERKQRSMVAEPICVNSKMGRGGRAGIQPSLSERIYSTDGKSTALTTGFHPKIAEKIRIMRKMNVPLGADNQGNQKHSIRGGIKTRFYAIPNEKSGEIIEVKNGQAEINGRCHKLKLEDGFYIFRKLTVTECERLQTLPDGYCKTVSKTQAYKALGNGWTAEVIIHLLNHALIDVPRDEEIVVLSMYDGIGTGRYCLDKMGFKNVKYYAYEIDQYAIAIAKHNYPDIIECGDAFSIRKEKNYGYQQRT